MTVRHMRLMLGVFFLIMGVVLLALRFGAPEAMARFDPTRLFLGALLALALGCWNLMKWYSAWMWFQERATPVRRPLQPDPTASAEEYNPEFDFDKQNANDKPAQ
jgi:hypothetical protein